MGFIDRRTFKLLLLLFGSRYFEDVTQFFVFKSKTIQVKVKKENESEREKRTEVEIQN